MREEDAESLLDDLRLMEPLLDGGSQGIAGGKKAFVAALLRGLGGVKVKEPRLARSATELCFAVRGCYEGSNQCEMLVRVLEQTDTPDAYAVAMKALWSRAHEALAELRLAMDGLRRRSS